jgi:lysyl-tRNA synthetase class 2
MAHATANDLMDMTEELLRAIVMDVAGGLRIAVGEANHLSGPHGSNSVIGRYLRREADHELEEADAPGSSTSPAAGSPVVIDFEAPFQRIRIMPALEEALGPLPDPNDEGAVPQWLEVCARNDLPAPAKPHTLPRLLDHLIGEVLEPRCTQPTFLCDHPASLSPLAKGYDDNAGITQRFELFVNQKELCNAYTELNDPDEQMARFQRQAQHRESGDAESHDTDDVFCMALRCGLPPTAGWGMGIDRLLMLLTGASHIREVLTFPVMKPNSGPIDDLGAEDVE